jgi:Fusaric acid resistance protein-like
MHCLHGLIQRFGQWLDGRDRGLAALRRAGRTALVMPAMFALGDKVIGNPTLATFAAFGSFAMLLLVDFSPPMGNRLEAQVGLAVVGGVFVCIGTLASRNPWLAAAAMAVVGFAVLFAGVVSSVLASATTSLLLAFILPVSLSGPAASIPDRLAGWGMASGGALLAVAVLWPAPARDPLRGPATAACRALAARLRSDVACVLGDKGRPSLREHDEAVAQADAAVGALHDGFLATAYRPTGLSTAARTIVRLVDELNWLNDIVIQSGPHPAGIAVNPDACAVRSTAASVLEHGADLLDTPTGRRDALYSALAQLRVALATMEHNATAELPIRRAPAGSSSLAVDSQITEFITSLDPSFRAQELSFAVSQIANNIDLAAAAERRSWLERLLGRQPEGLASTLSAAQERAAAHVERHSVWLHNSVRGAVGLGLAVLVANLTGVQHSFWVVLGTLSVLRSNALNTGQNVVRGLLGTAAGFVLGAALLAAIGTNTTLLWFLLPPAILLAGVAPAAISFAAGQAAFTLTLVILFNIIQPAGWRIGLLRVEDVALGCAVSIVVGLLFWPRGAAAALRQALAEAYIASARYLGDAVDFGMLRCDFRPSGTPAPPAPTEVATRAAAASRRLDDTFRSYLAERGAKPVPLADVTGLVTGTASLRLAADAVLDLWQRDDGRAVGDRAGARRELLESSRQVTGWYGDLADSLTGRGAVPEPIAHDRSADARLVDAVRHDLRGDDGQASAAAVRMIWTGDHLDAVRRLQAGLVGPGRAAARRPTLSPPGDVLSRLALRLRFAR